MPLNRGTWPNHGSVQTPHLVFRGCCLPSVTKDELLKVHRVRAWCRSGRAREIRCAARVSFREVGRTLGVGPSTVLRWERGRAMPTYLHALAYCDLLDALAATADEAVSA